MKLILSIALVLYSLNVKSEENYFSFLVKGMNADASGKYKEAYENYKVAAKGNHIAQNLLGTLYYYGKGVTQDYEKAVHWFLLSERNGNENVYYNLGLVYENGHGVVRDYREAVKWFQLSAESNDDRGQLSLGMKYANGEGVIQDMVIAHMWINIASANGNLNARVIRDNLSNAMTKQEIAEAQKFARECVAKNYKNC